MTRATVIRWLLGYCVEMRRSGDTDELRWAQTELARIRRRGRVH